jgi:urea carboxylase
MKTEINITAGQHNVGRKVRGFGRGIAEGSAVNAGDIIVVLE